MARARGVVGAFAVGLAVVWTASVAGCGPGKDSGTGPAGGSGPPSGDTSGGSGGSGGTPGTTGPAGGSSGGTASGGSAGDGTAGGTSGSTSGGTGSGGTAGGGTSGPPANPCDGLVPPAPDSGILLRTGGSCTHADSRTDGEVALGSILNDGTWSFSLFAPSGAPQGSIRKVIGIGRLGDPDAWFHATGPGWAGIVHDLDHLPPAQALRSWDTVANELGTAADFAVTSAPDGHGGTVMLAHPSSLGPSASTPTLLEWLDGSSHVLRTVTLDADPAILLVDWNTDHVLTIIPGDHGGRASARWYDGAGTPLTPWFDAGPAVTSARLHLLIDGSIALADGGTWTGVFLDGAASVDPPPAWLAARPGTRLATIRGGRGYAVLPILSGGGGSAGPPPFEIVAPTGDACGTVTLPADPGSPGVTVAPPSGLTVGQDGTVFLMSPVGGPAFSGTTGPHCQWRWWPGLLR